MGHGASAAGGQKSSAAGAGASATQEHTSAGKAQPLPGAPPPAGSSLAATASASKPEAKTDAKAASAKPTAARELPPGVTYDAAAGKYEAHARVSGRFGSLGLFKTAEEAHQAYLQTQPPDAAARCVAELEQQGDDADGEERGPSDAVRAAEFSIHLDGHPAEMALGFTAVPAADKRTLVVVGIKGGTISQWNQRHPERELRLGDHITEVAGDTEESSKAEKGNGSYERILEGLKRGTELKMLVRCPEDFRVRLSKAPGQKLGIEIAKKAIGVLQVKKVNAGGVLAEWNAKNPELSVQPYHHIVEVNGVRGDSDLMVTEVEFEQTVELVVR